MEIDVISFTDEQFARLTDEQLVEVKEVQLKKNKLLRALEKAKAKEKYRLLKNGVLGGSSYQKVCAELQNRLTLESFMELVHMGLVKILTQALKKRASLSKNI